MGGKPGLRTEFLRRAYLLSSNSLLIRIVAIMKRPKNCLLFLIAIRLFLCICVASSRVAEKENKKSNFTPREKQFFRGRKEASQFLNREKRFSKTTKDEWTQLLETQKNYKLDDYHKKNGHLMYHLCDKILNHCCETPWPSETSYDVEGTQF